MRFLYHLFGTLFFIVWTAIGVALIAGVFLLVSAKPWEALSGLMPGGNGLEGLQNLGGLGNLGATMNQAGAMGDLVKKMQSGQNPQEVWKSLPKAQQDCLNQELGAKTISDAMAGKLQPTPDLIFKAMKCLK